MVAHLWNKCVIRVPLTSYLKNEEKLSEWLKWVIIKFIVLCSSLAALYVSASSFVWQCCIANVHTIATGVRLFYT